MMTSDAILQGPEETVTITVSEYNKLVKDSAFLASLKEAGFDEFDNWRLSEENKNRFKTEIN